MGETKGTARRIKITNTMLAILVLLACIMLIAAVLIVPRFGKTFTAYRTARSEYKAAEKAYTAAERTNAELAQKVKEMKQMKSESDKLQNKVFTLAAKTEKDIKDGKSNKKICYITIDDGPYNRGKKFLELFKQYDVKATFFLTTANGDKLPDQADLSAKSMYPEYLKFGHTIGNHTYSHDYRSIYSGSKAFMKTVEKQEKFTEEAAGGYKAQIVRFPGGTGMAGSRLGAIQEALKDNGYGWIDWTVDSGDSRGKDKVNASLIKSNVLAASKEQKIMVILFHEWSQSTIDAMPEIIDSLRSSGYIFLPLFYESTMVEK